MLHRFRPLGNRILAPFVGAFSDVNPDLITLLSFLFAAFAFVSFLAGGAFLLLAFLCVLANGMLDGIDGRVARLKGAESVHGAFLDHMVDRYADILMVVAHIRLF